MNTTKNKKSSPRYCLSRLMLIFSGVLAIFVCLNAGLIYHTLTFFYSMENLNPPRDIGSNTQATEAYLSELKEIARFLLARSNEDRFRIILLYDSYINMDTSVSGKYGERVVNLYLLQRLIFDLPQKYPEDPEDPVQSFAALLWDGRRMKVTDGVADMLWPFQYDDDHHLTIKAKLDRLYSTYDGAMEYNYFASQFNFRSLDTLK
jgi:hypothetical protein